MNEQQMKHYALSLNYPVNYSKKNIQEKLEKIAYLGFDNGKKSEEYIKMCDEFGIKVKQ